MYYHSGKIGGLLPNTNVTTSQIRTDQELGTVGALRSVREMFPDGVSRFGHNCLETVCMQLDRQAKDNPSDDMSDVSIAIVEEVFEFVRRIDFPHMPSRFASLFCVNDLSLFKYWPEVVSEDKTVYKIEPSQDSKIATLDASLLLGGIEAEYENDETIDVYFSFPVTASFAYRYWSDERSTTPKLETLIELPAHVCGELSSEELRAIGWPQKLQ